MKYTAILLALFAAAIARPADAAKLAGSRPNIILVMTDDQGKGDIAALGNTIIRTPNIDALYARSVRFTNFHVSPTCAPTRSALMTGRHEFKNGVTHTILERERMTLKATTLAQSLHEAGYSTGIFGKWHLGDEEPYQPQHRGFDETFIHGAGGIGQAYDCSCADAPPNSGARRYFDNVIRHNGSFVSTKGFCTDVFFQAALGWIKDRHDAGKPFFAYITPNAPHGPMIAPEKYKQRFLDMKFDADSAGRMGMIENIDDNMGLMTSKLKEWGMEESTLLIFMTDNGQAGRQGRRGGKPVSLDFSGYKSGKGSPYEGGVSVPAFWSMKGVLPAGVDIAGLSAQIDIFPTLAELAGAKLPADQVEGRSLVPLLENADAPWADRVLFTHVGRWPKGADPEGFKHKNCAVRTARYRLVNDKELYDVQKDPFETANVIDDHPDEVARMRAAYDQWWAETVPLLVNEKTPNSRVRPFFKLYQEQIDAGGVPAWTPPEL
ncbi:MAG: arylsulfatase [Planctomycetales bacterium]|nr:arylsulfatase [Planctomycetales bacterium]